MENLAKYEKTLTKYKYWDEAENEGASVCGNCEGSCSPYRE